MRPLLAATTILLSACGGGPSDATGGLEVVRDTIGDTVVVRTLSGSVWGAEALLEPEISIGALEGDPEYLFGQIVSLAVGSDGTIYVVDRQGPELRAYGPDGTYRATIGRPGEGPGELKGPDGGLAVLSDGRILVRDPGNGRIQVYSPEGEPLATWPLRGNFTTSTPFLQDFEDNVHVQVLLDPEADIADWEMGLARMGPDGAPGDTLRIPDADFDAPFLEARFERDGGRSVSRTGVPFAPSEAWTLLPEGAFAHAISSDYRIAILRTAQPLRIERVAASVPVTPGEASEEERRITRNMRSTDPDWRWNGPPIPDTKPPFRSLFAGRDGRLWVMVSRPAVEVDDPSHDPSDPDSLEDRWKEPIAFDVFEPDGTYLGAVSAPLGFSPYPVPVFDGDSVWAVTTDELGVQRVVRFRVVRADET